MLSSASAGHVLPGLAGTQPTRFLEDSKDTQTASVPFREVGRDSGQEGPAVSACSLMLYCRLAALRALGVGVTWEGEVK